MNTSHSARSRFLDLIRRDLLELDAAELDFGIYRILNHRRATLETFLTEELPAHISGALAQLEGSASEDEQARIFNALYTFFTRYYDRGDFLPRQRRGKAGAFSVPYDGSDTHFHWATKGSHYVKSGERFAGYAYTQPDGQRVRLLVQAADVERDNAKGEQRHYLPLALQAPAPSHPGEWRLAFEHRALNEAEQAALGGKGRGRRMATAVAPPATEDGSDGTTEDAPAGASAQERLLKAWFAQHTVLPTGVDRTLLEKHTLRYVKGQSTDFFVHPQLGSFLRAELDHYLRAEFLNLWDLPAAALGRERGKLAICRDVGQRIISVLAALEDLQAALFEKRKFVLDAQYLVQCSWLRAQGDAGAALVAQAATHAPQVLRWRAWLGEADGSQAEGAALLARCPHLPLDTGLFDEDFRWAVLACIDNLPAVLGGVLVHGDNYAALRTLEAQWRAAVKCIYIDPPYNTGGDGFLYKDELSHSTWATFVAERISASLPFCDRMAVMYASIDENERVTLAKLLDQSFPFDLCEVAIQANAKGRAMDKQFSRTHEFCLIRSREELPFEISKPKDADRLERDYPLAEGSRKLRHLEFRNTHREFGRHNRENMWFPIYVRPADGSVSLVDHDGWHAVFPVWEDGFEGCWSGREWNIRDEPELYIGKSIKGRWKVYFKDYSEGATTRPKSIWNDPEFLTERGSAALRDVLGKWVKDSGLLARLRPKPIALASEALANLPFNSALMLDYFAGSGTTAHAVINLNREDGGSRRFILVEQGEYFDTVTLPRVAKVMACPDWKDGSPKPGVQHDAQATTSANPDADPDSHWSRRTLPVVQVLRIERYEDSLDALALPAASADAGQGELAGFDALLRYVADSTAPGNPARLSTAALARPFDYRLPTVWEGRATERPVDLLHTTLALLGLHLVRVRRLARPPGAGGGPAVLAEVRPHRAGLALGTAPLELLMLREHDLEALPPAAQATTMRAEYDWLAGAVQQHFGRTLSSYASVHHNRDLMLLGEGERASSIDEPLARAMWARDPAFAAPTAA